MIVRFTFRHVWYFAKHGPMQSATSQSLHQYGVSFNLRLLVEVATLGQIWHTRNEFFTPLTKAAGVQGIIITDNVIVGFTTTS